MATIPEQDRAALRTRLLALRSEKTGRGSQFHQIITGLVQAGDIDEMRRWVDVFEKMPTREELLAIIARNKSKRR